MTTVIHDGNGCQYPVVDEAHSPPGGTDEHGCGYEERDYKAWPLNGQVYNREPGVARMTDKEIRDCIEHKTNEKSWPIDLMDRAGLPRKNQKSSSYCHVHAPVHIMEALIVIAGAEKKILSAFYAGSQITGGRNVGGSGVRDVKWLVENGTCVESMWEPMKFKGENTPEIKANAKLHQITLTEEFEPKDHQLIQSSICQNQMVTVGATNWSHEIPIVKLVWDEAKKKVRYVIANSWGSDWGVNGCGVLSDSYSKFDEVMRIAAVEQSVA